MTDTGVAGTKNNQAVIAVSSTPVQGLRKAKNFTLRLQYQYRGQFQDPGYALVYWALVYVPQNQEASSIDLAGSQVVGDKAAAPVSMYEPNQNVIMSGILTPDQPVQTNRTRLARNLNSGDSIQLVYCWLANGNPDGYVVQRAVSANLNYAITY